MAKTRGGKRKRVSLPSWGAKKGVQLVLEGIAEKNNTNKTLTTRSLGGTNISLGGGRMLSKRAWKNKLWNDTLANQKYKSIYAGTTTFATPASAVQQTVNVFDVFDASNPFWTVNGGLQAPNLGDSNPNFGTLKVVIRGGTMTASFALDPAATNDVRIRVQWAYPKQQRGQYNSTTTTSVPINDWTTAAITGTFGIGFHLQQVGDYEQYWWPPMSDKEVLLKPGDSFEVRRAIRIKRVDRESILTSAAQFPRLFIYASNLFGATAQTLRIQSGYDLAFCIQDS